MKRATIFLALLLPISLLLGLGFVINGRIQAKPQAVDVGGNISSNTTWTVANSPYTITDTVTVEAGVTLTVEAGVTILVQTDMGQQIDVEGHLEAVGTSANPILITSVTDSAVGRWIGMNVTGSANFEYVTMRYAFTPLFITGSTGGDVFLENSLFEENSVHPIVVDSDALHRLKMNNVTFNNNIPNRVAIDTAGGNLTLAGSPTLGPQSGLEGYEEWNTDLPTVFSVPEGFTLTLEPGTNLMMLSTVQIAGHLAASGTVADPVLWQTVPGGSGSVFSVVVMPTGTAVISNTVLKGSPTFGIAVVGESDNPVVIENSTLEDMGDFPMIIEPPSLHRVQMNNVIFLNNAINQVLIDTSSGIDAIVQDAVFTAQPGLDYYQIAYAAAFPPSANFEVPNGITLTVEPGVELRFGEGAETFLVNGRLQAIGTPSKPITFTSANDLAPSEWVGLQVSGGSADLTYVELRNGDNNLVVGGSGTAQLDNTAIRDAAFAGLTVDDGTVTAVCSTFSNNGTDGIVVENNGMPSLSISSSTISGNGGVGLNNLGSELADARHSWWGDASGPGGIGSGSGDTVQGNVLYDPWFTEETCITLPYQLYLPNVITP
ncbi:MAG: hypothetical protein GY805_02865 [Chloroflexi bacterium]|nr:hypothetical protein [Chloroflexota bacterium]